MVLRRSAVRVAIRSHYEQHDYRLPHQALWFVLMLIVLLLLLGKTVLAQCVIA
jgi:hypothetical protein